MSEPTLKERMMPAGNIDAFPPPAPPKGNVEGRDPAAQTEAFRRWQADQRPTASGWQCPGCTGVYAPWVPSCPNCRPDVMAALRKTARLES